jgi:acetolactate decarboxylase
VFEGFLPCSELKENGDVGFGSYTRLAGEMVMFDTVPFKIAESGKVSVVDDSDLLVDANATHFTAEDQNAIPEVREYAILQDIIDTRLPSRNCFYAFKD